MKARYIAFTVLQALFCAVAPIVFIFVQYGDTSGGLMYKLPLGILLFVIALIIISKNTFLKPRLIKLSAQIAQHEADLKIESDQGRINNLIAELRRERVIETVLNCIMPLFVLAALLVACKALEKAVLELSGAIGFALGSYVIGFIFGILAAREVHSKHEAKEVKDESKH